ncbi:MAG: trimethylamine methyltransferase family protein, partial [Desulfobacterales bacterium]
MTASAKDFGGILTSALPSPSSVQARSPETRAQEHVMNLKGLAGGQYQPLSANAVHTIHEAALVILETTGFTFESGLETTLAMLEQAGAGVDRTKARIFFPRGLVEENIARAP